MGIVHFSGYLQYYEYTVQQLRAWLAASRSPLDGQKLHPEGVVMAVATTGEGMV